MVLWISIHHKAILVMELLQIDIFERFVAANTKKYQKPLKLLFLDGKNWIHANPFTELGARDPAGASVCWGVSISEIFSV